jgi:hypothetical protein
MSGPLPPQLCGAPLPHDRTLDNFTRSLTEEGFTLSQILIFDNLQLAHGRRGRRATREVHQLVLGYPALVWPASCRCATASSAPSRPHDAASYRSSREAILQQRPAPAGAGTRSRLAIVIKSERFATRIVVWPGCAVLNDGRGARGAARDRSSGDRAASLRGVAGRPSGTGRGSRRSLDWALGNVAVPGDPDLLTMPAPAFNPGPTKTRDVWCDR